MMKKLLTLYIGILFAGFAEGQMPRQTYYTITDTLSEDTISISVAQWEKFNEDGIKSVKDLVEYYKDSLYKDSVIITIRKYPLEYDSFHGGSYDYYYGYMKLGNYIRSHDYGSSAYDGSYNDDVYWKNGKYYGLIRTSYLPSDPERPYDWVMHFQLFSIESIFEIKLDSNIVIPKSVVK